ncbi:YlxM family DNA-binding protein [Fusobacterium massiliense]|uniref:YlxM family DNA-binding protein n=1 Tax=Fusobacterium massiliense TaxID=1852365 RepID=UPI0028EB8C5D|nr:sigma factor-like helix-turn-helix DNA-binding protein [Fusobacterium massiliense]
MILDEFIEIANLLEIYGSLLSDRQREYLEDHFDNDLSLSEIAKNNNVSRQAIHDNIKRGINILYEYENKLQFYRKKKKLLEELNSLKDNFSSEYLEKIINEFL